MHPDQRQERRAGEDEQAEAGHPTMWAANVEPPVPAGPPTAASATAGSGETPWRFTSRKCAMSSNVPNAGRMTTRHVELSG
jgi:hypothetical protein